MSDRPIPPFDTQCKNCLRKYCGEHSPDECPYCGHTQKVIKLVDKRVDKPEHVWYTNIKKG